VMALRRWCRAEQHSLSIPEMDLIGADYASWVSIR